MILASLPRLFALAVIGVLIAGGLLRGELYAEEPLHARIDQLIAAKAGGPLSRTTTDEEFLRRIYLDLAGRIPSVDEASRFLDEPAANKRAKLVDRLLAGSDYPRRMRDLFHVMLMERRGDHDEWLAYLEQSFAENKPWDQLVREIVNPDADNEQTRSSAFFITKRLEKYGQNPTDYPGLVRDVGRLFLGVDVQCAQCHDHLFVDDYKQVQFQGMYAYFEKVSIRRGTDFPAIVEAPLTKKVEFMSVFTKDPQATGPRLPFGEEIAVPAFKRGEEYETPPDRKKGLPGVLKFSTLDALAEQLPRAGNDHFKRNIANRLWFVMMGRGLVDPLDLHHSGNPPSHPALLDLLSEALAAHRFDMKWLIRELALTQTYARSSLLPEGAENVPPASYRTAIERPLSAEQVLSSLLIATGQREVSSPSVELAQNDATSGKDAAEATSAEKTTDKQHDADDAKLKELRERFLKALANPPREPELEFSPTVRAALFMMNDSAVLGWLKPGGENLVARLAALSEPDAIARELYLALLSRRPTQEEIAEVTALLDSGKPGERAKDLGYLVWALAASTEFCTNH